MKFVADLHLHSKYSRAVSRDMVLPIMAEWGAKKGTDILSTGDWTHPLWLREIRGQLEEAEEGLYKLNASVARNNAQKKQRYLLSVEISSIYSQGGKVRRIHNLVFVPSFESAEKINKALIAKSANLMADGRPIIGLSSRNLIELVLTADEKAVLIPCHAWTPWFSLYGSNSGFDSIEECFEDYAKYIYGIETGLSSDPEMNWRIKELTNRSILSFSDAHSPAKMGREATIFDLPSLSYANMKKAIMRSDASSRISGTIEFYPEEGKYHYNGHRNCKVVLDPQQTKKQGVMCPVCKKKLTVGVMDRVEQLATQSSKVKAQSAKLDSLGVHWIFDPDKKHPPFVKLVPLNEIIAESLSSTVASQKVKDLFDTLCYEFTSEIHVLLKTKVADIEKVAGPRVAEGVAKVRSGDIVIEPGYDGEYGKVKIWSEGQKEKNPVKKEEIKEQIGLF